LKMMPLDHICAIEEDRKDIHNGEVLRG
jgi:hypothetical protein